MSRFPKLLFFTKVLLGMSISLVLFAAVDIRWWQDEGIIIPILLLENAIISFYIVYRLTMALHFPSGQFSIIPVVYGILVPLGGAFSATVLISFLHNSNGMSFYGAATIILIASSVIAATLTFIFSWLFMKISH